MQKLTVLGAGVLGSQIAFQSAYSGKDVVVYDINPDVEAATAARWEQLAPSYLRDLPDATEEKLAAAVQRLRASHDLADAVRDADLIIEAVPERIDIKQDTWKQVSEFAPAHTLFATNSSTLLPSDMAPFTDRPERFLSMHFANQVWKFNICEIMRHPGTSDEAFDAATEFAEQIGMVPIRIQKEQPGYVLNSLLVPLLSAAATLLVRGIATPEDIDRTWRISTGAPSGPFEIFDVIGMMTPYMLFSESPDPEGRQFAEYLKTEYIDKGHLGITTGQGFYKYNS